MCPSKKTPRFYLVSLPFKFGYHTSYTYLESTGNGNEGMRDKE